MSKAKKARTIPILFVLLLALLATFVLLNSIASTSTAPYIGTNADSFSDGGVGDDGFLDGGFMDDLFMDGVFTDDGITDDDVAGLSAIHQTPDSSTIIAPSGIVDPTKHEPSLSESEEDHFITVQMEPNDIFRGSLILVNYENRCEFPDMHELVDISEFKTRSYRVTDSVLLLSSSVIEPLNDMMDAFYSETECNTITITSAFREYIRQQEILDEYTAILGRIEAKKRVALPGHSEHNAGLAVDFGVYSDGELGTFLHTGINGWFFINSYKYGFIPRYPENKTDITKTAYEPWHFRYVGVPHAYFIRQSGLCLEEYIEFIMGFTRGNPHVVSFDGEEYEIYFTREREITIPSDKEVNISGNNIDGFIVTIKL